MKACWILYEKVNFIVTSCSLWICSKKHGRYSHMKITGKKHDKHNFDEFLILMPLYDQTGEC